MEKKYDINYDYEVVLLLSDNSETLIGGSDKTINKALKSLDKPNLAVKDLDIFFREQPLGTFALDICSSFQEAEKLQELTDRLYANLKDERTNRTKVAETLNNLDYIFKVDKSVTLRLLARTISKWYKAVTALYMNGRHGFPLKQEDRALLGEEFRDDVETLIADTLTTLKKKKSPQDTEILSVIQFNCREIAQLLTGYLRYLESRKVFCIQCKLCGGYFLAKARNTLYCKECKVLRKKNSKAVYREKCSEELRHKREQYKYLFENFIHKNKLWSCLSEEQKVEYQALRNEYVRTTAYMLREYEKSGDEELRERINHYINDVNGRRGDMEYSFSEK